MRLVGFGAAVALTGCVYSFSNPVDSQAAGTVTGRVVLDGGAPGQTIEGTRVDLLWSALSIQLGATGRFAFLDLPDGTYTLRYTVPPPSANDLPIEDEQLDVYLPWTAAQSPDTIALGDIQITTAGEVQGNAIGQGAGVVVGAFTPDADGGVGEYEGYSTTTDATGHYVLFLPAGTHQLWASTDAQSGTLTVALPAGQDLSGEDLEMETPPFSQAQLSGYVVLDPNGAHDSPSDVGPLLVDGGLVLDVTPVTTTDPPYPEPTFTLENPVPSQGVSAVKVTQVLPPGALYDVICSLPAAGSQVPAVPLLNLPLIAGRTTLLRQIFLLRQTTLDKNGALPIDAGAPAPDAGLDAGVDAGIHGGMDAGVDGGGDAGLDAGPDAGFDAGPPAWILVAEFLDPGLDAGPGADGIVPFPLPGADHEVVFSEAPLGEIDSVLVSADAGPQSVRVLWSSDGGGLFLYDGTLAGATNGSATENAAVWLATDANEAVHFIGAIQSDGGVWGPVSAKTLASLPAPAYPYSGDVLAPAYDDATGVAWVAEVTSDQQLALAPLEGTRAGNVYYPPTAGSDAGVGVLNVAAAHCAAADGGAALCLSYADTTNTTWLGVFDVASLQSQFVAAYATNLPSAGVAVTQSTGEFAVATTPVEDGPSAVVWVTFGSLSAAPEVGQSVQLADTSPALFDWNGEPFLAFDTYQSPAAGYSAPVTTVLSLGPDGGAQPPPLPSTAGSLPHPRGFVGPKGNLFLGLPDATGQHLQLYELRL